VVDWSQFLTNGGTRIDFGRVAEVGVGTVFGAVFTGIVSVLLGLVDIPLALLGGLTNFLADVVGIVAGLPAVIVERGWAAAIPFVLEAGPAGYIAGLSIALVTLYVIAQVVSGVRE
jgi:hypothetical protein